jgi:heterodisulfide reductase subunit C
VNLENEPEKEVLSPESPTFEFLYKKENLIKCLQCGRCTAGCPAAKVFSDYSPREIVRRAEESTADEPLRKTLLSGFAVSVIPVILGALEITLQLP